MQTIRQRGARRGHDGRADCRASGQRRHTGHAARSHARRRRRGARSARGRSSPIRSSPKTPPRARRRIRFATWTSAIAGCDWIVEAVVERLDVKQALLARVDDVRNADAIVSSNTSGIPIASIAEGRSESFRRHWLGTHFFNPPRYLKLLEIIPTADTDPAVVDRDARVRRSAPRQGRRDRQGHAELHRQPHRDVRRDALLEALDRGYTIEEIDAITGPAIGRPKSATFRTLDITGIDVLAHVSATSAGTAA